MKQVLRREIISIAWFDDSIWPFALFALEYELSIKIMKVDEV